MAVSLPNMICGQYGFAAWHPALARRLCGALCVADAAKRAAAVRSAGSRVRTGGAGRRGRCTADLATVWYP